METLSGIERVPRSGLGRRRRLVSFADHEQVIRFNNVTVSNVKTASDEPRTSRFPLVNYNRSISLPPLNKASYAGDANVKNLTPSDHHKHSASYDFRQLLKYEQTTSRRRPNPRILELQKQCLDKLERARRSQAESSRDFKTIQDTKDTAMPEKISYDEESSTNETLAWYRSVHLKDKTYSRDYRDDINREKWDQIRRMVLREAAKQAKGDAQTPNPTRLVDKRRGSGSQHISDSRETDSFIDTTSTNESEQRSARLYALRRPARLRPSYEDEPNEIGAPKSGSLHPTDLRHAKSDMINRDRKEKDTLTADFPDNTITSIRSPQYSEASFDIPVARREPSSWVKSVHEGLLSTPETQADFEQGPHILTRTERTGNRERASRHLMPHGAGAKEDKSVDGASGKPHLRISPPGPRLRTERSPSLKSWLPPARDDFGVDRVFNEENEMPLMNEHDPERLSKLSQYKNNNASASETRAYLTQTNIMPDRPYESAGYKVKHENTSGPHVAALRDNSELDRDDCNDWKSTSDHREPTNRITSRGPHPIVDSRDDATSKPRASPANHHPNPAAELEMEPDENEPLPSYYYPPNSSAGPPEQIPLNVQNSARDLGSEASVSVCLSPRMYSSSSELLDAKDTVTRRETHKKPYTEYDANETSLEGHTYRQIDHEKHERAPFERLDDISPNKNSFGDSLFTLGDENQETIDLQTRDYESRQLDTVHGISPDNRFTADSFRPSSPEWENSVVSTETKSSNDEVNHHSPTYDALDILASMEAQLELSRTIRSVFMACVTIIMAFFFSVSYTVSDTRNSWTTIY